MMSALFVRTGLKPAMFRLASDQLASSPDHTLTVCFSIDRAIRISFRNYGHAERGGCSESLRIIPGYKFAERRPSEASERLRRCQTAALSYFYRQQLGMEEWEE